LCEVYLCQLASWPGYAECLDHIIFGHDTVDVALNELHALAVARDDDPTWGNYS